MKNKNDELKRFAEALLDIDRLKIIGELARGNGSISNLAERVRIAEDIVISHLEKLSQSGVISLHEQADGALTYLLNEKALGEMSERQISRARALQNREADLRPIGRHFTQAEKKYIRSFTNANGIIRHLPSIKKRAKLLALLKYAKQDLEPGKVYTEAEFNDALARFTRDYASIRRELVEWGLVDREADGSAYWLKDGGDD